MIRDLITLANTIDLNYALKEHKQDQFGWDLESELSHAKNSIRNKKKITNQEFKEIVNNLCFSMRDHHVQVEFFLSEYAELPFTIREVNSCYLVTNVQEGSSPIALGDELLQFNQQTAKQAITSLINERGTQSLSPTYLRQAEQLLTCRSGITVPKGKVFLKFKKATGEIFSISLNWKRTSSCVKPGKQPLLSLSQNISWKIWQGCSSQAAIYTVNKANIGVFCLPSFLPKHSNHLEEIRQIIAEMERKSDLLIIDLRGNGGGRPLFMFSVLSMLTEKPLEIPTERILLNQRSIDKAFKALANPDTIEGFYHDILQSANREDVSQSLVKYYADQISEWELGNTFTKPIPFLGHAKVNPHPTTRYTKPVIILIDELSFSCAELFAAILQDNRRATLLGTTTAGAGAACTCYEYPNFFGVKSINLPHSLLYRSSGECIEDVGVKPDIPYELDETDIRYDYQNYKKTLQNSIKQVFERSASALPRP